MVAVSRALLGRALVGGALALVLVAGAAPSAFGRPGTSAEPPAELLPDLAAVTPSGLIVGGRGRGQARRFWLSFVSAADNVGAGPLTIRGQRPDVGVDEMTADQIVRRSDGSTVIYRGVGKLRFVSDPTHRHWHLLRVMLYELRRERGLAPARPDEKRGFCLGDRYETDEAVDLPGEPSSAVYTGNCGPNSPRRLTIEEGISVGYGDDYKAWRDGQEIDVTGLPAGRYRLVHRVNPGRRMRESSHVNNVSALLVSLTWPNGRERAPRVRVLGPCEDAAGPCGPRRG